MKNNLIIPILIIIIGLSILFFFSNRSSSSIDVFDSIIEENATTTYTEIHISYPSILQNRYQEVFDFIQSTKDDFLSEYDLNNQPDQYSTDIQENFPYELSISTKVSTSTKTTSYIIEVYEYIGGVHGETSITTFTYDYFGNILNLNDILKGDYIKYISSLSRNYFYQNLGDDSQKDMIDNGTEPKPENFSSWYLTDDTLVFIFGEYQIGPYVIGIKEFPIYRSEISNILNLKFK